MSKESKFKVGDIVCRLGRKDIYGIVINTKFIEREFEYYYFIKWIKFNQFTMHGILISEHNLTKKE